MNELEEREQFVVWRKRNKITLEKVSQYIGCSISTLSRYETGKKKLYDDLLEKYREFKNKYEVQEVN
jgi:transcriptional regulator with XRE-family HTH domain